MEWAVPAEGEAGGEDKVGLLQGWPGLPVAPLRLSVEQNLLAPLFCSANARLPYFLRGNKGCALLDAHRVTWAASAR